MKSCLFRIIISIIGILPYASYPVTAQTIVDHTGLIWDARLPFPAADELSYPDNVMDVMIHRAGLDAYQFLHDAAIIEHKSTLFVAWYNCPRMEMQETALIRVRRSFDNGLTWSSPEIIASDKDMKGIMYVPVVFLSFNDTLYAFIANMKGGPDQVTRCEVYRLNEKNNSWRSAGVIAGPFLPNCNPVKMEDNNYIMAGRKAPEPGTKPIVPAVAISHGGELTRPWDIIPLRYNDHIPEQDIPDFPETTVIAARNRITAFVRNHSNYPLFFVSEDYGRSWSDPQVHNFPFASSKIYAGSLSTGQYYVLANIVNRGYRDLLVLAVSRPEQRNFSKIWKIRDGYCKELRAGPEWSYPSAIEYAGRLYIVYTSEKHHCCLTIIPVSSLKAD